MPIDKWNAISPFLGTAARLLIGPRLFATIGAACVSVAAHAVTIHVPGDQPTIQAAIDAAAMGDTILVAPGRYQENLNTRGKAIFIASEAGPAATIIDGSEPANPDTASVIFIPGNVVEVRGFTITGGSGTAVDGEATGGGLYVRGRPTIRGNWITANHALLGGAITVDVIYSGAVRITGNRIYSNSAGTPTSGSRGGAIYIRSAIDVQIEDNSVFGNHAVRGIGGAVYDAPQFSVHNRNVYACNVSDTGFGALYNFRSVRGCTFVSNEGANAALEGLGFVDNSTITYNTGGGIVCGAGPDSCNDVYGNRPFDVYGSCIVFGQHGNVSVDPVFGDADSCGASFCLAPDSPLLPENSPPGCRLIGARDLCEPVAIDAATSPEYASGPLVARPNPFNSSTELSFRVADARRVRLEIVDALGHTIRCLLDGPVTAGDHRVAWDARDGIGRVVAAGAYIAVLTSPASRYSQKVLLIK